MAKVNIDENSDLALDHGVRFYYRPQRSCGKVMFLHLSVILSTGGGALADTTPPQADGHYHRRYASYWNVFL